MGLLAIMPCLPIGFATLFLGPFTMSLPLYCSYGLIGHHSCYIISLSLPLYFMCFLGPFTSSLLLIILMGLLLHFLGFLGHLLLLYLLLASWACWLSILPLQPIRLVTFFFFFLPFCSSFLLISLIFGFLLLLGPLSKIGINKYK